MQPIQQNLNLKKYNTFGIDVNARFFLEFSDLKEFITELSALKNNNPDENLPLLVLGGGSNILFTRDFEGIMLHPVNKGVEKTNEDENHVLLKVQAGENWDDFVGYCVNKNWSGIENLSFIPGNVGACPIQNIGAYGVEIKNVIESVEAVNLNSMQINHFTNNECRFGYRDSIFKNELKNQYLITSVNFRLNKSHEFILEYGDIKNEVKKFGPVSLENIRKTIISIRQKKLPDPSELGNAGSFFKNPVISQSLFELILKHFPEVPAYKSTDLKVKIPAGWLIEKCGWKGKTLGKTGIHKNQALVIINYGNATGEEIINLARQVQDSVLDKFEIKLEMEVNII